MLSAKSMKSIGKILIPHTVVLRNAGLSSRIFTEGGDYKKCTCFLLKFYIKLLILSTCKELNGFPPLSEKKNKKKIKKGKSLRQRKKTKKKKK